MRITHFLAAGLFGLTMFGAAPPSYAEDAGVSTAQIIQALKQKRTRGLSLTKAEVAASDRADELRKAANQGTLTTQQRAVFADATKDNPSLDVVIYFDLGSAAISPESLKQMGALGRALESDALKGSTIVIQGHTDALGPDDFNQRLSEQRAAGVKEYLTAHFAIDPETLTVMGYGKERLKDPSNPFAGVNRRVQFVNMSRTQVGSRSDKYE